MNMRGECEKYEVSRNTTGTAKVYVVFLFVKSACYANSFSISWSSTALLIIFSVGCRNCGLHDGTAQRFVFTAEAW